MDQKTCATVTTHMAYLSMILTRAGPGVFEHPPPAGFSQMAEKRGRGAPPFLHSCPYIFSTHFVKISDPDLSWSGHQVTRS